MFKKMPLNILLLGFLVGCSSTQNSENVASSNERILFPTDIPHNDVTFQSKVLFKNNKEAFYYTVDKGEVTYPHAVRSYNDAFLKKYMCSKLDTYINDDQKVNNYYSLTWTTVCLQDTSEVYEIHKVITGIESTYHVRRQWKSKPEDAQWKLWLSYIEKISLCDIQNDDHVCLEDFVRIK